MSAYYRHIYYTPHLLPLSSELLFPRHSLYQTPTSPTAKHCNNSKTHVKHGQWIGNQPPHRPHSEGCAENSRRAPRAPHDCKRRQHNPQRCIHRHCDSHQACSYQWKETVSENRRRATKGEGACSGAMRRRVGGGLAWIRRRCGGREIGGGH